MRMRCDMTRHQSSRQCNVRGIGVIDKPSSFINKEMSFFVSVIINIDTNFLFWVCLLVVLTGPQPADICKGKMVVTCCCTCCNLSAGVALNMWFTTNRMCVKNNTHVYVTRTSNNRVIMACDLYCCLLPQCEVLRTCHSDYRKFCLICIESGL